MPLPRLRTAGAATLMTAALALSACGSSDADDAAATSEGSGDGAFPVSIESTLGTAEITEKPEKVVTLGQGSTETSIAPGAIPVGMEEYALGRRQDGLHPVGPRGRHGRRGHPPRVRRCR
uniref:Uncharacterized protein n=1 Tax=Janibacter limosus TaxID=53458 RepID=A0AC61U1F0_9MICO|nr:hypothetical protein [Janibacter limosus]